jgi:hypothetical protein
MSTGFNAVIRHYVLATENLARVSGELHEWLGLEQGRNSTVTVTLGFVNEMMMVGSTMLEVVQPIWPDHRLHAVLAAREGDCGHMIVLQVDDSDTLRERGQERGLSLIKDGAFKEQKVLQFDPAAFGTRFETYEYNLPDGWWGAPETHPYKPSTEVREVVEAEVAVENPAQAAAQIADLFQADLDAHNHTVRFGAQSVRFVESQGVWRGLVALEMDPLDPLRKGQSKMIAGTDFRFV